MVNPKPDFFSVLTILFISAPSCGDKGIFTIYATLEYIVANLFQDQVSLTWFHFFNKIFYFKKWHLPQWFFTLENHQPTYAELLPGLEQYYTALQVKIGDAQWSQH